MNKNSLVASVLLQTKPTLREEVSQISLLIVFFLML